jgi:hypothetical protein
VRHLLAAIIALQRELPWPSVGALILADSAAAGREYAPTYRGPRGSFAKQQIVRVYLGTDSPEYQRWDQESSERRRAEMAYRALTHLFERALLMVVDPSALSVEAFKQETQFLRSVFGDDTHSRHVGEAFGKAGLQSFRQFEKEARTAELDDLYRASVAMVTIQRYAFILTL